VYACVCDKYGGGGGDVLVGGGGGVGAWVRFGGVEKWARRMACVVCVMWNAMTMQEPGKAQWVSVRSFER